MSKMTVATVNNKIESHEAVCAERWLEVINRVKRLEHFIAAASIVTGKLLFVFRLRL